MSTSIQTPAGDDIHVKRMRRTTLPDNPRSIKRPRHRRSTRLGMMLFLKKEQRLSPGNIEYLINLQGKVRTNELERAIEVYRKLSDSKRAAARAEAELLHVIKTCTFFAKSNRHEQRRIGVGYRDKGSLRPKHEDHMSQVRAWWSEDIAPALLSVPEDPQWVTADEFYGPERYDYIQELALMAYIQNTTVYLNSIKKFPNWPGLGPDLG